MAKGLRKAREAAEKLTNQVASLRPSQEEWLLCMIGGKELCLPIRGESVTSEKVRQTQNHCHTCQQLLSKRERQGKKRGENLPCEILKQRLLDN